MAFKIVSNDEVSMLLRPSDDATKSFMVGRDPEPFFAQPLPPEEAMRGIRRNLHSEILQIGNDEAEAAEAVILPPPSAKDMVRVFLRIKPRTEEESHYYSIASQEDSTLGEDDKISSQNNPMDSDILNIETEHQLALHAPKDSNAFKNGKGGDVTHRFSFTKIFSPETEQSTLFGEVVQPRLQDFLHGRNQLVFTYGATSSGKTFTIQGDSSRPGILPRALDVLFNSIGSRHFSPDNIKPLGYNRVAALVPREKEKLAAEKKSIIEMGSSLSALNVTNNVDADESQASIASVKSRIKDKTRIEINNEDSLHFAIWISFAEIYNENIYDLFDKIPEPKNKGEKPRRLPLKLADDKGGWVYIKGLKEVSVTSADEAYQLLQIGRQNLQFAATRLNHNSSRSHCIFNIKIVRVADIDQPHLARVSMLSFCDLAGAERIKKTLNTGDRQKEAGNINTSLLVLGRCIKAIRHNQTLKDPKKKEIIPFRDSKLTRLFQSYLTGSGKVSMVVNMSQSSYLFDETLQVLKFSAIASRVELHEKPEPKPVPKKPIMDKAKRKTRFSIMVENNKQSLFGGRGSIAWENPQFRSTICPNPGRAGFESTVIEADEDMTVDETNLAEETVIESKYDGLLKVIENLKNQLIEEKQKNLKIENETRTELCEEFNKMMVEIETSWEQRLQEEKDRATELSDWRISKLEEALRDNRRRARVESDEFKTDKKMEAALSEKETELGQVQEELEAMKSLHDKELKEKKQAEDEVQSLRKNLKDAQESKGTLESKIESLQKELDASNQALKSQSADPKITELEVTVKELRESLEENVRQITDLKTLLDEAGQDYLTKDEEIKKLKSTMAALNKKISEKDDAIREHESQSEELKALLSEATSRSDEKELVVFEMEEKIETLKSKLEEVEKENDVKWSAKMASDQQMTNLNDEIEHLRAEKKKQRAQIESRESELAAKEKEIENLERETKTLIKMDRQAQERVSSLEGEITMLRKQVKELSNKTGERDASLKEKSSIINSLQVALDASKKEDNAIEALRAELEAKRNENEELQFAVKKHQSEVEARDYDVKRIKDDRDQLMSHYEQQIKKINEDLVLERREITRLREVMQNSTPIKQRETTAASNNEKEMNVLREELAKKSELIKTLAAKVTTPKRNSSPDDCCRQLKTEHAEALERQKSRFQKIIEDYKECNTELLKHVPASAARKVMSVKRTVEDSEDENQPPASKADKSTIEATPSDVQETKRGRAKRGRKKMSATTQVSFDDDVSSSVSTNFDESSNASVAADEESKAKRPRRGARVSRAARPSKKYASKSVTEDESINTTSEPLADTSNKLETKQEVPFLTPMTKKRKLFPNTPKPDAFTPKEEDDGPVDSPHSIVKRQLRSRNIRIKQ